MKGPKRIRRRAGSREPRARARALESDAYNFKRGSFGSKVNRSGIRLPELSLTSNTVLQGALLSAIGMPPPLSLRRLPIPRVPSPDSGMRTQRAFRQCCTA